MVSVQYPPKHRHVLYQSRILLYYILWIYKFNSFIGRLFPWYIFTVVDTVGCKLYYCPKQYKRHTHYIKNYFIVYISRIHSLFTWRKLSALRSPCTTRWSYILGPVANLHDFIEDDTWKKIKQFLPIFENNCGVVFFLEISKLPPSRFYIEIYC